MYYIEPVIMILYLSTAGSVEYIVQLHWFCWEYKSKASLEGIILGVVHNKDVLHGGGESSNN